MFLFLFRCQSFFHRQCNRSGFLLWPSRCASIFFTFYVNSMCTSYLPTFSFTVYTSLSVWNKKKQPSHLLIWTASQLIYTLCNFMFLKIGLKSYTKVNQGLKLHVKLCACMYIKYVDTFELSGDRTGQLKSLWSPTPTVVDKTNKVCFMTVLSWSYSRKLRRNWHIQLQLTQNQVEGETQHALKANLGKEAFSFAFNIHLAFWLASFNVTEFQYKLLCEHLWISNGSHNSNISV